MMRLKFLKNNYFLYSITVVWWRFLYYNLLIEIWGEGNYVYGPKTVHN